MLKKIMFVVAAIAIGSAAFQTDALARGGGGGGGGHMGGGGFGGGGGGHFSGGGFGGGGHLAGGFGGGRMGGSISGPAFASGLAGVYSGMAVNGGRVFAEHGGNRHLGGFQDRRRLSAFGGWGGFDYGPYDDTYASQDCYRSERYHTKTGWHWRQTYVCS